MAGIPLLDNLVIRKKAPNVERDLHLTIEAMKNYNPNYLGSMHIACCVEDGKVYVYNESNSFDEIFGFWRPIQSGGTTELIDYYKKNEVDDFLDTKVDKEDGKGLSTNDFTTLEKEKLATLENYDDSVISERVGNAESSITDIQTSIGNTVLSTEKQTITEAINEVKTNCDTKNAEVLVKATANEEAIAIINGDSTVSGSIKRSAFNTLKDSKAYTDQKIAEMASEQAIVADEKPSYSNGITTYIKDGIPETTDEENIWFYYEEDGKLMQTIFINGEEITIVSAGSVNFQDFVSKTNDVVSTYDGNEADTSKIGDLGALQALETKLQTNIDTKITGGTVVDNLEDTSAVNVLSANQGRLLNEKVNEKLDKIFVGDDIANKHLITDSLGNVALGTYDDTISDTSTNAVQNKVIKTSLDTKFDKTQDIDKAGYVAVIGEDGNMTFTEPTTLGGKADIVSYENEDYPELTNVSLALKSLLDKVHYLEPELTSFTISPPIETYEIGSEITDLQFSWSYNKEIKSQALTDCTIVADDRSAVYPSTLSATKTFTLTFSDGQTVKVGSKKISFLPKIYYGASQPPENDEYNSSFALGLSNAVLATTSKRDYSFVCGSGEYAYVICPVSMTFNTVWVNGFQSTIDKISTFSLTNESGYTQAYDVLRMSNSGLGSFTMTVK